MSFDARAKRYFPFIVLSMLALAAWFQASAIGSLIAASAAGDDAPSTPALPAATASASDRSGAPILARNPFDSATGALDQQGAAGASHAADGEGDDAPEEGDRCAFGRVTLIIAADDPRFSVASISGADGRAKMRWVGDEVDGHRVAEMSWDRVILEKASRRCQLVVGAASGKALPAPAPAPAATDSDDLAAKIEVVSETEVHVDRSVLDRIVGGELIAAGRMRPVKEGDRVVGLRISQTRPGSLVALLGLKNGDQLQSLNGFALTDPEKLLEAQARLAGADRLSLSLLRDGRPLTIDLNVRSR
jgi:general secretion pathway protein C